jgi:hypothetical protein
MKNRFRLQIDNKFPLLAIILALAAASDAQDVCPKECILLNDPICGYDGKKYRIFGNSCFMEDVNECEVRKGDRKFEIIAPEKCPLKIQ